MAEEGVEQTVPLADRPMSSSITSTSLKPCCRGSLRALAVPGPVLMQDVRAYVGIPFRERGRDHNGCDCWGLVAWCSASAFSLELPSLDGYASVRNRERIQGLIEGDLPA
jgi:hypothetical protein